MISNHRIKTIFSHIQKPVDVIILKNATSPFIDPTFFYVSELKKGLFEESIILLYPDGSSHIFISSLEKPLVPSFMKTTIYNSMVERDEKIRNLISPYKNIGINTAFLLYTDYKKFQKLFSGKTFVSISKAIFASRLIKDKEEIYHIKEACLIADKVMKLIPSFFSEPITEQELAAEIEYHLKKFGAGSPAFETISSFGQNTAKPHYTSGKKLISPGDFVLCDFGATIDHYHSDISRTFVYGKASEKQKRIHRTVLSAQEQALNKIKPGVPAKSIHDHAKKYIDSTDFKGYFIHSTGHSLGLNVHDPGIGFSSYYKNALRAGMILTVEPGIYIPEIGGVRIEDDIVVSSDGFIQLTNSSKDLIEIPIVK